MTRCRRGPARSSCPALPALASGPSERSRGSERIGECRRALEGQAVAAGHDDQLGARQQLDRAPRGTRLNSSARSKTYGVFCSKNQTSSWKIRVTTEILHLSVKTID